MQTSEKIQKEATGVEPILRVEHLKKYYTARKSVFSGKKEIVKAVDDVSFELLPGETLGIVGESGCGKSTTIKAVLQMIKPTAGKVELYGQDFTSLTGSELKKARRNIKLIFQDPYSSLNPRMTVQDIIGEPLDIAKVCKSKEERNRMIEETMLQVGLNLDYKQRYPHEFSGGQRQRIGIARAIILRPQIVVCDEPVSALDVSIQAKIINLLKKLQKELGISYIFISHDLGVVQHIADRVAVMYKGKIVEEGPGSELFAHPAHPYTRVLLDSIPKIGSQIGEEMLQDGEGNLKPSENGCSFCDRCSFAQEKCYSQQPELTNLTQTHRCACFQNV